MALKPSSPYFYSITCNECGAKVHGQHDKSIADARLMAERKLVKHNREHKRQRIKAERANKA